MIQELHYSLDEKDRYYRFFSPIKDFRHTKMQPMVNIDYTTNMILVVEYSEEGKENIVGLGAFFKTYNPSLAELSFVVHKDWRGLGMTQFLLKYLAQIGKELGYKTFGGSILIENRPMIHIINSSGYNLKLKKIEEGVFEFAFDI